MEALTLETVKMALVKLAAHYPESGHNGQTIAFISEDFLEDLRHEGVTPKQFTEALKIVRRRSSFFPKMKDVLDAREEYCRSPERFIGNETVQIAESSSHHDPTPEEQRITAGVMKIAGQLARQEITAVKAASLQEDLLKKPKKFKGRLRVVGE